MLNLDDVDLRILRAWGGSFPPRHWALRAPYAEIARTVGVDEETVRLRLKRARERGLLASVQVMPNARILGYREASVEVRVATYPATPKAEAIAAARGIDGVVAVVDFRDDAFVANFFFRDEAALRNLLRAFGGIPGANVDACWERHLAMPGLELKGLDWRILHSLRHDAWREPAEISEALHVSVRTVQRRLAAMTQGKAVYLTRPPNVGVVGGLMCLFFVTYADEVRKRSADFRIHSLVRRIGMSDTTSGDLSVFGVACQNFTEADQAMETMRSVEGVSSVRMHVVAGITPVPEWLDGAIAKAALQRAEGS